MFTRRFMFAVLALLPVSPLVAQGERIVGSLEHEGIEHGYILYVPSQYDPADPMPLVLNFHGGSVTAADTEAVSGMNQVAEEEGFLVAYPSAVNLDWIESDDHHISFVGALLDALTDEYAVDSRRVYATGGSQGGIMSFVLAAALPDRFAAAAPLAGTRPVSEVENRQPTFLPNTPDRPFPLLYIHGSADPVVPYHGGAGVGNDFTFPSVSEVLDEWVDLNGGTSLERVASIPGFHVTDGTDVWLSQCIDCGTYLTADGDEIIAEVIHMRVNGLGHQWPEPDILMVSAETWNFFRRHQLAVVPEPASCGMIVIGFLALVARARRH